MGRRYERISGAEMKVTSKGFIAGLGLILYAIGKYLAYGEVDVNAFFLGLGIIGIRHAIAKV